jgi:UDP-glucose 4-epimerase
VTHDALVTGSTGFIGGALVRRLSSMGKRVLCPVRPGGTSPAAFTTLPGVTVIHVSLEDRAALRTALAPFHADIVINLASYGVRRMDRDPASMLMGNAGILGNLIGIAAEWRVQRFLHAGSCSELGTGSGPRLSEDAPLAPTSIYGAAKAAATLFGTTLARDASVPFNTLRLFGCYGPGEHSQRLIPYLIERLRRDERCDLTPGEQVRDLTYIDDIVEAFVVAAEAPLEPGSVYHVCSGRGRTVREVGEQVADILGKPRELLRWGALPHRDDEPRVLVGDPARFAGVTGWAPRVELSEGIRRMVNAPPSPPSPP